MGRDMGNQAKRHHIDSTFYLRHFADEAERITTVMLPGAMPLGNRVDPHLAGEPAVGAVHGWLVRRNFHVLLLLLLSWSVVYRVSSVLMARRSSIAR